LPIDIFIIGFVEPLNNKDTTNRQGTLNQYVLTQLIKRYLPILSSTDPTSSFVANQVWKRFFDYRSVFQAWSGIENSYYEEIRDEQSGGGVKGIWIKGSFRSEIHDFIMVYLPNFVVFGNTPHFYTEYMMTLHSLLLLQGFKSPAIFIPYLPTLDDGQQFPSQLVTVLKVWEYVTDSNPGAKFFLSGDSSGGNLVLSFLLFRNDPKFEIFDDEQVQTLRDFKTIKPDGSILISPILKFAGINKRTNETNCSDFISSEFICKLREKYLPDEVSEYDFLHSPGYCNNVNSWKEAFPTVGILLIWGSDELMANEIEEFGKLLSESGKVKKWKGGSKIHSWPFMSFTTETQQDEKEDSCFMMAGIISRMILWQTPTYLEPETAQEPMNLLTIDDEH
ncbi:hypothetical protein CANARDRAFT_186005, partial [[Candida] arabinofermentans NRRL YB-2248]